MVQVKIKGNNTIAGIEAEEDKRTKKRREDKVIRAEEIDGALNCMINVARTQSLTVGIPGSVSAEH